MPIFVALIITDLQRKCKNNAEKFGFWTILYYLCTEIGSGSGVCESRVRSGKEQGNGVIV